MAFVTVEDTAGAIEVVVFPEAFAKCASLLDKDDPIVVQGILKQDERGPKIIAESVVSLQEVREMYIAGVRILLQANLVRRAKLEEFKRVLRRHYGPCPVSLALHFNDRGER